MREFKLLLLGITITLSIFGCSSSEKASTNYDDSCPTCNMKIPESKLYTASINIKNNTHYFDDIGCMVLFAKENKLDLHQMGTKVFTNDTKHYIDSSAAYYKLDEHTPMSYGFSAYEKEKSNTIRFEDVIIKMLRGEHMANPKIRKRTLGSKA